MTTTDDHVQSASDDLDTQQQQQRSIPVTIPSSSFAAFPPFFANPFMTPYLPQQQQQHAPALGPQPFPIDQQYTGGVDAVGNNCRINPITGGYFLAPNQYHELMQQYLQSLVHASNVVYPQESMSTSEECTTKLANLKLQQPGGQQERLLPAYLLQQMMPQTLVSADESFGVSPVVLAEDVTVDDDDGALSSTSSSCAGGAIASSDDNSPSSKVSSVRDDVQTNDDSATSRQQPPSSSSQDDSITMKSIDEHHQQQSSSTGHEHPTAALIKKQMTEIDKEMARRVQNKNVKKIDGIELEQLLVEQQQILHEQRQAETMRASALPWPQSSVHQLPPQPPTLTDLQRVAMYNNTFTPPPEPPLPHHPHQSTVYQTHYPQAGAPQFTSSSFHPQFAQPIPPQYAAALLQQMQQHAAAAAGTITPTFYPPNTAGTTPIEQRQTNNNNTWPGSGAIGNNDTWIPSQQHQIPATTAGVIGEYKAAVAPPSKEKQLEEDKIATDNGEEPPVWVMRESYLKRLKREEDRAQEIERRRIQEEEEEQMAASAAVADAAHIVTGELDDVNTETDKLLTNSSGDQTRSNDDAKQQQQQKNGKPKKKEVMVHEPAVLIEGVLFRARYLGSTQLVCEGRPSKTTRMMQAQEAVARIKAPDGEPQPSTDVDLFISTEKIMVLNTDLQDILMDHALRTISYIADIGDIVVLMARRMSQSASAGSQDDSIDDTIRKTPRVICHVFESDEASFIAQSIGQAFQVAYVEFLRANGIDDPNYLREIDYQEVLNSQELMGDELEMFSHKETQKDVVVPKPKGEPLGLVVVESGWGSMLPTVVIANMQTQGAAWRCNLLNIGDQIIAINGISLVGLPLSAAQQNIKNARSSTAVKLTVVHTPPVVEVRIKRPDTKYQLGFSVQNGVICSLLRGGIAERGGIRVGHRIIEINGHSVVAVAHEKIVNMLATAVGEIHMKTMPTSMFRLLTGQEVPNYI